MPERQPHYIGLLPVPKMLLWFSAAAANQTLNLFHRMKGGANPRIYASGQPSNADSSMCFTLSGMVILVRLLQL